MNYSVPRSVIAHKWAWEATVSQTALILSPITELSSPVACLVTVGFDWQGGSTRFSKRYPSWATSAQFFQNKTCFRLRMAVKRHPVPLAAVWPISIWAIITKEDNVQSRVSGTEIIKLECSCINTIFLFCFFSCGVNRHRLLKCWSVRVIYLRRTARTQCCWNVFLYFLW